MSVKALQGVFKQSKAGLEIHIVYLAWTKAQVGQLSLFKRVLEGPTQAGKPPAQLVRSVVTKQLQTAVLPA